MTWPTDRAACLYAAGLYQAALDMLERTGHAEAARFRAPLPSIDALRAAPLAPVAQPAALMRLGPTAPATEALVARVLADAAALAWRQPYGPEDFPPEILDATRWAPIADRDGPLILADALLELMTIDREGRYPLHSHAPEELYVVLAGSVYWTAQGDPAAPAWRRAGEVIRHPPHRPRALETGPEAVLLLTIWRGGGFEMPSIGGGASSA